MEYVRDVSIKQSRSEIIRERCIFNGTHVFFMIPSSLSLGILIPLMFKSILFGIPLTIALIISLITNIYEYNLKKFKNNNQYIKFDATDGRWGRVLQEYLNALAKLTKMARSDNKEAIAAFELIESTVWGRAKKMEQIINFLDTSPQLSVSSKDKLDKNLEEAYRAKNDLEDILKECSKSALVDLELPIDHEVDLAVLNFTKSLVETKRELCAGE